MSAPTTSDSSSVADQNRWFNNEVHAHDAQLRAYLRLSFPSVRDVEDVVLTWPRSAAQLNQRYVMANGQLQSSVDGQHDLVPRVGVR